MLVKDLVEKIHDCPKLRLRLWAHKDVSPEDEDLFNPSEYSIDEIDEFLRFYGPYVVHEFNFSFDFYDYTEIDDACRGEIKIHSKPMLNIWLTKESVWAIIGKDAVWSDLYNGLMHRVKDLMDKYEHRYFVRPNYLKVPIWLNTIIKKTLGSELTSMTMADMNSSEEIKKFMGLQLCPTYSVGSIEDIEVF